MKKFLALLMAALLLPAAALAELTIAGCDVSAGGYWTTDGTDVLTPVSSSDEWHISYDADANILTLNGALVTAGQDTDGLVSTVPMKIVLTEGSVNSFTGGTITPPAPDSGESYNASRGVYVKGGLTVSGKGTLHAQGGHGGGSYGLIVTEGHLTVKDSAVEAIGGDSIATSVGLMVHWNVNLTDMKLTARSGATNSMHSYGIWADNVLAENCVIEAHGGNGGGHCVGVYSGMDLTDTKLTATADLHCPSSTALSTIGEYKQKGGTAEFSAGTEAFRIRNKTFTLSAELEVTGAGTPDGELGPAVKKQDAYAFVLGDDPNGTQVPLRLRIAPPEEAPLPPDDPGDGDGAPLPPDDPGDGDKAPLPDVPETGDASAPALWLMLALLTMAGAAAIRRKAHN
ncbi:MAG: hypothetical protein IJ507_05110 [Clostridia bacterium]|nr:hypothetical protein [Clostridia bacterium]